MNDRDRIYPDTREWLLTNGLGSFASGTVSDANTRAYHGWLMAALHPPGQRTLLLARMDATIEVAGQTHELATNFWSGGVVSPKGYQLLQSFHASPCPTWVWGKQDWQLTRQLIMPYGLGPTSQDEPAAGATPPYCNRILIRYRYEGRQSARLCLRPLIADRTIHAQQQAESDLQFIQLLEQDRLLIQAQRSDWMGTSWQLRWTRGQYHLNGLWYWGYRYPEETQRGLSDREDLYSPGWLEILLQPQQAVTLEARVREGDRHPTLPILNDQAIETALADEHQRLATTYGVRFPIEDDRTLSPPEADSPPAPNPTWAPPPPAPAFHPDLLRAADQFVVHRTSIEQPTVIAGYPWFTDWGRDTLIALPGLALHTRRFDLAQGLLHTFGHYCQHGLIPNGFPDNSDEPFYNSIDAALWWIEDLGLYLNATQDWIFLKEQIAIVWRIYKGLMAGTWYNIRVDAVDGLLSWDAPNLALTWMDALVKDEPVTPRQGKAIEINALWFSVLNWLQQWATLLQQKAQADAIPFCNQVNRFAQQQAQVKASLQKFWNPQQGYLYDVITPDDYPDARIRPNAVIALSLAHCAFPVAIGQSVLQVAIDRLLTPYGLRSLDPADPAYIGRYEGNAWQRDRAYHQGTVWPWLLGAFVRSWQRFYPDRPLPIDWQPLLDHLEQQACLGSISELFDGDPPHTPRGAIAQAWSVAEVLRYCNL